MKPALTLVLAFWLTGWVQAQTNQKPVAAKQETAKKDPPTLGFNQIKDVSPVLDEDAYMEEVELEKQLPGNQFVHDKRAMHEAGLMNEFM
jgi:hypothetical protein